MYREIAEEFHKKFISEKIAEETYDIAYKYVKFIIDLYRMNWEEDGE